MSLKSRLLSPIRTLILKSIFFLLGKRGEEKHTHESAIAKFCSDFKSGLPTILKINQLTSSPPFYYLESSPRLFTTLVSFFLLRIPSSYSLFYWFFCVILMSIFSAFRLWINKCHSRQNWFWFPNTYIKWIFKSARQRRFSWKCAKDAWQKSMYKKPLRHFA